jgi:acyl-coenzyme A synthetase/AMP-(fatty) acid ligase/aryl carrier-like protein
MQGTPATWKLLLEAGFAPVSGFKVLCGGEAWSRDLADRLLSLGCRIWNMYGPTETTIWSSITPVEKGTRPPYIQSSVANTTFYVLDTAMQPLPFGVPGQLFIGGDSVARGYFRRPDLTASRFVSDAFAPGNQRMYATGDRVRLHADGSIEFLGRADFQVKIRGYRIELGEVESAFTRVTGVSEAVAVAHNFGNEDHRLVLYYVSGSALENASVRNGMRELVPDYMVPAMFVCMDVLPLTDNGKIDRKALPSPTRDEAGAGNPTKKPQTYMEETLASICAQALGVTTVGVDEDLMDLGADSIHLFQITARATQKGLPVTAKLLWSHRTVERICAAMESTPAVSSVRQDSTIRPRSRERYRVPVAE